MEEKLKEKNEEINKLIARTLELMPEEGKDKICELGLELEEKELTNETQAVEERE